MRTRRDYHVPLCPCILHWKSSDAQEQALIARNIQEWNPMTDYLLGPDDAWRRLDPDIASTTPLVNTSNLNEVATIGPSVGCGNSYSSSPVESSHHTQRNKAWGGRNGTWQCYDTLQLSSDKPRNSDRFNKPSWEETMSESSLSP